MLCGFTTLNGRTRSHHACSALGRVLILYSSDIVYRIQKTPQSKPRVIYHDWLHLYNGEAEPTCLPSLRGKSSEASVGEKSLPPPPGISGSKSAGSKKRNMMTSGSPSTKGGPDILDQGPQSNVQSYKATDHKHSDSKTD